MTHPHADRLQDWLDGLLAPAAAAEVQAHVAGCPACTRDAALYRTVFAALDAVPLPDPGLQFTERLLDRVLPSRVRRRRRRLEIFGWGYAGLAAACAAVAMVIARVPSAHAAFDRVSSAASHGAMDAGVFAVSTLASAAMRMAASWGMLQTWIARVAPLGHAIGDVLRQPVLLIVIWAAILTSAAVLWWMRPRAAHASKEMPHVGLLGF